MMLVFHRIVSRATVRFCAISPPGIGEYRIGPPRAHVNLAVRRLSLKHRESASPKTKAKAILSRAMSWFAEPSDPLPDSLASYGNRLIGHYLRFEPQTIFGVGLNGDAEIRSIRQIGS